MISLFKTKGFLVPVCTTFFIVLYLLCIQGYATGYGFTRVSIWHDMQHGYILDGGEWGFGRFVPIAIIGLLYAARNELLKTQIKPNALLGGGLMCFALFLYFGGYKANEKYIGFASIQILVAGLIFWFLGVRWFVKCFWLWCLLGMMWPWRFLIEPISFPLQIIMVKLTSGLLSLIGVEVVTRGTAILTDTPDPVDGHMLSLNIAAACSGLRSLFALVMIGFIIGYLQLKEDWKRLILMLCVPLVAVVGNFVRMIMLYFGSKFGGSEFAIGKGEGQESSYHIMSGLVVFMVAVLLMLTIVQILTKGMKYFGRGKIIIRNVESQAS